MEKAWPITPKHIHVITNLLPVAAVVISVDAETIKRLNSSHRKS